MHGSINQSIKNAINGINHCGAAEKLATQINGRQEAYLKGHIKRQWLQSRRLVLSNKLKQEFSDIQYRMSLLQCDQKDKIPHRILLNSLNKPYPGLVGKYIPGNFIHRQFSAYCQYFAEKYFSKEKITLTQEKTKGMNQFSAVQDYVDSIHNLIGRINQKTQNNYAQEGKKLIIKSQNLLSKFTEFSRANNFERYQLLQIKGKNPKDIWDKFSEDFEVYRKNIKKNHKFSQQINKQIKAFKKTLAPKLSMVFKDIQDNFQSFKNDTNERNHQQNQLRTSVEQYAITSYLLNSQIPRMNDYISYYTQKKQQGLHRNRFVNNYLKKQHQKRKNQIKTRAFDFDNMQKEICNFGLGRVSYATKTQFFVLSPLCFDECLRQLTDFSQGFSDNHQKQYYHVEKQILRAAQKKINQLKEKPQVQLIIIDMFTQLQPCYRSEGQNSSCTQFIEEWQKKMKLDPPRKLILRISYNNSHGSSSENSQEVEVGKIHLQDQKGYDQNHQLKLLFNPEHVFGCKDLNLNTYQQTVRDISNEKQKALRDMKGQLQSALRQYQGMPHGRCLA